jgi:hypothetical protein
VSFFFSAIDWLMFNSSNSKEIFFGILPVTSCIEYNKFFPHNFKPFLPYISVSLICLMTQFVLSNDTSSTSSSLFSSVNIFSCQAVGL